METTELPATGLERLRTVRFPLSSACCGYVTDTGTIGDRNAEHSCRDEPEDPAWYDESSPKVLGISTDGQLLGVMTER